MNFNIKKSKITLLLILSVFLIICSGISHARTDQVVYFLPDAQGSAIAAVTEEFELCWEEEYTPYGNKYHDGEGVAAILTAGCGLIGSERGFTGHIEDVSTDLVYMQQRYYDPSIGRFLSIDPAGVDEFDSKRINRYSYAENDPLGKIDPDGRNSIGSGNKGNTPESDQDNDGIGDRFDDDHIETPGLNPLLNNDPNSIVKPAAGFPGVGVKPGISRVPKSIGGTKKKIGDVLSSDDRALMKSIFKGDSNLSKLPKDKREAAAKIFDQTANLPKQSEVAIAFNNARSSFLRGQGPNPGPDANSFAVKHGIPFPGKRGN